MSQENVEIVRAICEAFVRGDYAESLKRVDPAFEMVGPGDVTFGSAPAHGHEQIQRAFDSFLGTWSDYRAEVQELRDFGDNVLVETRQQGRGRGSGVDVAETVYVIFTVAAGRVVRAAVFRDRSAALEALGMSE